jgi:hypothetical protein
VQLVSATDPSIGGEPGLAVSRDRLQVPVRSGVPEDPLHEQAVVAGTGEPVEHRGHLHEHVLGEQPLETLDIGVLERLHVAIDPGALLGCGRLAATFLPDPGFLHTGTRPLQGTVHRHDGSAEDFRCLGRGEAEHVTQDQRTTLTRRQVLQGGGERQAQAAAVDHGSSRIARVQQGVRQGLEPGDVPSPDERPERIRRGHQPRRQRPAAADLQGGQAGVRRDPVQPRAQ